MAIPDGLKYTKSHEWIRIDGDRAYVGITDFAQDSLGDIVYLELPETNREVSIDEELTTIESVKAAEPIFAPISGTIAEVNESLNDNPEKINEEPYSAHIFVIKISDPSQLEGLLDAAEYESFVEDQKE